MKAAEAKRSTTNRRFTPFFGNDGDQHFFEKAAANSFFQKSTHTLLQPKLDIGQPNDPYEKEADAMADRVAQRLATPDGFTKQDTIVQSKSLANAITPLVQTKCAACEEEEKLQKKETPIPVTPILRKPIFESNEEDVPHPVQRKCTACEQEEKSRIYGEQNETAIRETPSATKELEHNLKASRGRGTSLSGNTRASMENAFGTDFSNVKIHTDHQAIQMSRNLAAQAFTHGTDIYFNESKYNERSSTGQHLLAHELTHVVQQKGMVQKKIQRSDFCKPYATTADAASAKWWLRNTYMRAEGIETFGTEVYNLYDSYLSRKPGDSLAPRIFDSDSSYIHNSFKDDGYIKDDMDAVLDLVGQRLHRIPGGPLRDGVESLMSLSNFLSTSEMENRPINFGNPFSVSGHIAGDIGSSDAGNDYRKITRANVAITKVVLFGNTGYHLVELIPHYEVFDTIDFCPGDPGAPLETLVTTPMSRLEASGEAYDMPFKVIFSPESRSKRYWF